MNSIQPRVLIFEDDTPLRDTLSLYLKRIGFEVVSFPDPCHFSFCSASQCPCQKNQICADVIITDMRMPCMTGLEFIQGQLQKGCKIKNIMVMSADFTTPEYQQSMKSGYFTIAKPFSLSDIKYWLEECKNNIDPNRDLATGCLKKPVTLI